MAHGPAGHLLLPLHPPAGTAVTYRYYRWTISARRVPTYGSVQAAEFQLLNGGVRVAGATPSGPWVFDSVTNLYDNNTSTKWFAEQNGSSTTLAWGVRISVDFDFGTPTTVDGYRWYTANDFEQRDPFSWEVYGSNDSSTWTLLDMRSVDVTMSRGALVGPYSFTTPTVPGSYIRYLKFECTKRRSSTTGIQMGELAFEESSTRLFAKQTWYYEGSADDTSFSGAADDARLNDGNNATKWYADTGGQTVTRTIIYDFCLDAPTPDAYWWYTGDDESPRDPVSWTVSSSQDGVTWNLLDTQTDYATTTSRSALVGPFTIELPAGGAYTEFEWQLGIQAPAADGDTYEFRIYDGTTPFDTYSATPQLTVEDAAESTAAIPTAIMRLGPQTLAAAGTGDTSATVPVVTMRIAPQTPAGAGTGGTATTIPAATASIGPRPLTAAGTGGTAATVPTVTMRLGPQPVATAVSGTATAAIPTATLVLDGKLVQVSGADISAEVPTATLQLGPRLPTAAGTGGTSATIPVATAQLGGQALAGSGSGDATRAVPTVTISIGPRALTAGGVGDAAVAVPSASLRLGAQPVVGLAGSTAAIPTAILQISPRVPAAAGSGAVSAAIPFAVMVFAAQILGNGLMEAILTCRITGPALRRLVTGPAIEPIEASGPSNEPVEGLAGPALSRTPDGPALITRMTDGPGIQAHSVEGPELSRDVTGPAVEEKYVLTGPGACGGN